MTSTHWDRTLEVSGTPYERGEQQGSFFRGHAVDFFQSIRQVPFLAPIYQPLVSHLPLFVYRTFFRMLGKKYRNARSPFFATEGGKEFSELARGLSHGFGFGTHLVYGLHAYEALSSRLPYRLGCCALALSSSRTADSKPWLAYNHDFPDSFGRHLFIRRNKPRGGFTSLTLSYPPIGGSLAGMNEKGLAFTLNHAYSTDVAKGLTLFPTVLLQLCLNRCANIDEAISMVEATPVSNGSILTCMDAEGNHATLEVSATRKTVLRDNASLRCNLNWYASPQLQRIEVPRKAVGKGFLKGLLLHGHNIGRSERFEKLLSNSQQRFSEEEIRLLLSDHNGTAGGFETICRHHPATTSTLASVFMSPVDRLFKVILGQPCRSSTYRTFSF